MKRILVTTLALSLGLALSGLAQSNDEETLRAEVGRIWEALETGDSDYFRDHYVSEVSRFHLQGRLDIGWDEEKADGTREFFESGWRIKTDHYELDDVRIYGDIAITAGTAEGAQVHGEGGEDRIRWRFTYVWAKRDGRWVELHHHVSALWRRATTARPGR